MSESGVNQNRYLLQLIGEFRLNAAIGRVAAGTAFAICKSPFGQQRLWAA